MPDYNFDTLRERLEKHPWPSVYMFKFIVPSDNRRIALIESLFGENAEVRVQSSSEGNYTSVTAREVMLSADSVIDVYKKAAEIDGIISL